MIRESRLKIVRKRKHGLRKDVPYSSANSYAFSKETNLNFISVGQEFPVGDTYQLYIEDEFVALMLPFAGVDPS